ncbi:cytochrome P460 family protein [Methyloprofundus sp.]|uniref:cytochrome P460 family protein n=1 Tax=Methyloprofundus sp. TaxID=2020875 RepID=UPI003D150C1B
MVSTKSGNMGLSVSVALVIALGISSFPVMAGETFSANVDDKGNISLPKDFRAIMVHLGSWFVPEGDASGFHDVYTEQKTVEVYRKTGKFPDGATLIKELRASKAGDYTTGKDVHYATKDIKQWFVMVKDTENRFADNKSWGDGWGWALFKPGNMHKNVSSDYKTDCLGCHVPAREKDWIYYPTLMSNK